jgi:hypothetical protein
MKVFLIITIFLLPILVFSISDFGNRLLVYPSTFSVDLGVYVNNSLLIKTKVFVVWWLKIGFQISYPESVSGIFVMSDFSNDLTYSTYIHGKNVYTKPLGDSYSTLDFFKKYVIQIIRNYYIYNKSKESIPFTGAAYYIKTKKDSALSEIDFVFNKNIVQFSFSDWNFDVSKVMDAVYSYINKNKIQM